MKPYRTGGLYPRKFSAHSSLPRSQKDVALYSSKAFALSVVDTCSYAVCPVPSRRQMRSAYRESPPMTSWPSESARCTRARRSPAENGRWLPSPTAQRPWGYSETRRRSGAFQYCIPPLVCLWRARSYCADSSDRTYETAGGVLSVHHGHDVF